MSVLTAERIDRPPSLFESPPVQAGAPKRDDGPGGRLTLDEAIVGAWEGLAARSVVSCPCCGGALQPHVRAGATAEADVVTGRCDDCGFALD